MYMYISVVLVLHDKVLCITIHVPSMLAKGVALMNKHNKQAATMAYKIHKTQPQRA